MITNFVCFCAGRDSTWTLSPTSSVYSTSHVKTLSADSFVSSKARRMLRSSKIWFTYFLCGVGGTWTSRQKKKKLKRWENVNHFRAVISTLTFFSLSWRVPNIFERSIKMSQTSLSSILAVKARMVLITRKTFWDWAKKRIVLPKAFGNF